jgi:hypothetical protein
MRLCRELGIEHAANLIIDFPGSTGEEVAETVRNVLDYAIDFQPLNVVKFQLGVDSTVDTLRETFGITRARNKELYRAGMPGEVWSRLLLFDLDFDQQGVQADWTPVKEACDAWYAKYSRRESIALFYQDGGDFLIIVDDRDEARKEGVLEGLARDIYLHCLEIRTLSQLQRKFGVPQAELMEILQQFVDDRIMFTEQGSYLSLAVAPNPLTAVRRIRASYEEEHKSDSLQPHELTVMAV